MAAEPWRVAQIVAGPGAGGKSVRGSGYLVAPGLVLTAAHVLAGASLVRVRLDAGQPAETVVQAERWWVDPEGHNGTDLAVIAIPAEATKGRDVDPAGFGGISDCTAVLAVQAFGFPFFKLRRNHADTNDPEVFRDLDQVAGHVPVAANRRQGTLAFYLDDPPPVGAKDEDHSHSPWEGMSGAAVWASGRIIGVIAEHHPSEGTGRLTVRRIDRACEELPTVDRDRITDWLRLGSAGQLTDVTPADPRHLLQSAFLEQVRDIAPERLTDRHTELAEWAEFCAGPETYAWWQAEPWAGKTALASWFVIHPPAGMDVVSFFVTGRLAGQSDSDAFLDAMIEQLNALDPADGQFPQTARARIGAWLRLLKGAAARAEQQGRRLLVVVDGLDEDEAGVSPRRGQPSIASLLPRRTLPGARFIITSRPSPGLPDDVPSDHPLRTCIPRHLQISSAAQGVERRAKQELQWVLNGGRVAVSVVGYIVGSGGGLTEYDLSVLTRHPPHELQPTLSGVSGRTLVARMSSIPNRPEDLARVYLFAHETLRVTAERQLGDEVSRYRNKIHDWIASYARRGWPVETPAYAVRGYMRLLAATGDSRRLSTLARDPRRHVFLLKAAGSDYAVLTEIRAAQRLISSQNSPDLRALAELAVYQHAITVRNRSVPVNLPAVWTELGRFDRAEALARIISQPDDLARALIQVATAAAGAGDLDRAEALARTISGPDDLARALIQVATAAAQAGDLDRAEALAHTISGPDDLARALIQVATAAAQAGDLDRAEALAHTISGPDDLARALTQVATAAAQAGDLDRAARSPTAAARHSPATSPQPDRQRTRARRPSHHRRPGRGPRPRRGPRPHHLRA